MVLFLQASARRFSDFFIKIQFLVVCQQMCILLCNLFSWLLLLIKVQFNIKVVDWFGDLFGEGDYLDYEEDYTEVLPDIKAIFWFLSLSRRWQQRNIILTSEMNLCHKDRLGKVWKYSTEGEEGKENTKIMHFELFCDRKRGLIPERMGPTKSFFSQKKDKIKRKTEFDLLRSNR